MQLKSSKIVKQEPNSFLLTAEMAAASTVTILSGLTFALSFATIKTFSFIHSFTSKFPRYEFCCYLCSSTDEDSFPKYLKYSQTVWFGHEFNITFVSSSLFSGSPTVNSTFLSSQLFYSALGSLWWVSVPVYEQCIGNNESYH